MISQYARPDRAVCRQLLHSDEEELRARVGLIRAAGQPESMAFGSSPPEIRGIDTEGQRWSVKFPGRTQESESAFQAVLEMLDGVFARAAEIAVTAEEHDRLHAKFVELLR